MSKEIKENSAIQTHINTLQSIISRMANNSANCKTWAITIVSAVIVLLIDKSKPEYYYFTYIPLIMFWLLDCFYLGLEHQFRGKYNTFISDTENSAFDFGKVYRIEKSKGTEKILETLRSMLSVSTTPFYVILCVMVYCFITFF